MFCPECGTLNPDDSKFCGGCGNPLARTRKRKKPTTAQSAAPPPFTKRPTRGRPIAAQ